MTQGSRGCTYNNLALNAHLRPVCCRPRIVGLASLPATQRITACLPEFDLVLTAEQQVTLAELVAHTTVRLGSRRDTNGP